MVNRRYPTVPYTQAHNFETGLSYITNERDYWSHLSFADSK